jgi:hypothetical protein
MREVVPEVAAQIGQTPTVVESHHPPRQGGVKGKRRSVNGELLLDIASAANFLGFPEKALRARVERRLIPFRRLQGRIVFLRAELEAFIAAQAGCSLEEALGNIRARGEAR